MIAALVVAACAVGVLTGCGSSDSDTGTTAAGTAPSTPSEDPTEGSESESSQSEQGGDSDGSRPSVDPAPLKVSGGGSAQYRVAGGDNSVQEFGEEGDESELEEAAAALHAFLVARAEERWTAACSQLAKTVEDQLGVIASRDDGLKGKGCAAVLGTISPPLPAAVRNETTVVDAGSLRLEDERAFLIYGGPKRVTYAILMEEEDGSWKVGALSAIPLS